MTRRELFPILNCSDIQAPRAMLLVIQAEPDTNS